MTIDELFKEVVRGSQMAATWSAQYDASAGYPTTISIDWIKGAVNDEESYQVRQFAVLK